MNEIAIKIARKDQLDWINTMYQKVDFKPSHFENEFIVIAEVNKIKAGLGRLVQVDGENVELGGIYVFKEHRKIGVANAIVSYLCKQNPFTNKTIWCLPFENLEQFYQQFGFDSNNILAPKEIIEKYHWCNKEGQYAQKVLLLSKTS